MSDLNHTPNSERMQIGFFGRVNAGKSSLFNLLTGQELAVVSDKEGTTTDPVKKAMELLPIGPVMLYDTPGLLDESTLGAKRLKKTDEILRRIDIAIVVADAKSIISEDTKNSIEKKFIEDLKEKNIPYFFVLNKIESIKRDELDSLLLRIKDDWGVKKEYIFEISCISPDSAERAYALRERIAFLGKASQNKERHLVSDIIKQGDIIILVIPIDESAPKGRIILPQQQVIRDALNVGAIPMAVRMEELSDALSALKNPPALVITDSQAFSQVEKIVPESIPLTSFSILMARYKGDLEWQAKGALSIDKLPCGACILISEGCTHHRQCGDIGTVKLPDWIKEYTNKDFNFSFTSGGEFPPDLKKYDLIIHCGGCTLPAKEMAWRIKKAKEAEVPVTNYGTMIAYLNGILDRATVVFKNRGDS